MSFDGGIANLASWAGNTIMPTLAGSFFSAAVFRYSKGATHEQYMYGGFAALTCSGIIRALEGFVQNAGATRADAFWLSLLSLVNWTSNVILPVYALTQLGAMALHFGGVLDQIYPGTVWIRKFISAIAALMISGLLRFAESMASQAHGI